MSLGTKLTAADATDAKHWLIRHLRDPNPKEEVPDQDSAKDPEKQV